MKQNSPKVSVIMPVYNREKYVSEAIESILNQTFTDFEFIIIDDGSTDSTAEIIKSFKDNRIQLINQYKNLGNYRARNDGMKVAQGKYICVMDSDDIALPNRIQKQLEFLEINTQIGICGSYVKIIDSDQILTVPEDYNKIKVWLMCNMTFIHPTIFIRAEFLKKFNLKYNDSYRYAGDYDFLVKAAHLFPVTNIPEVLLEYRKHSEQITNANKIEQGKIVYKTMINQLMYFKKNVTDEEKNIHLSLINRISKKYDCDFKLIISWANFLLHTNIKTKVYDSTQLAIFFKNLLKYKLNHLKSIEK